MRIAAKTLIGLILIAVLVLLVVVLMTGWLRQSQTTLDRTECLESIENHLRALTYSGNAISTDIRCLTRIDELKGDEEENKRVIAEEARTCWETWREGEESFFVGENTYCHICTLYTQEKKQSIERFDYYLQETYMLGTEMTYAEYFTKVNEDDPTTLFAVHHAGMIQGQVAVLFVQSRGIGPINTFTSGLYMPGKWVIGYGRAEWMEALFEDTPSDPFVGQDKNPYIINNKEVTNPKEFSAVIFTEYDEDSLKDLGCTLMVKSLR